MKNDPVHCWHSDGCGWIRIVGDACFLNAERVKEFAVVATGRGIHKFVVDLAECTGLDSTFMGTLAGIALRLQEMNGDLHVVHLKPEHEQQLRALGLGAILKI